MGGNVEEITFSPTGTLPVLYILTDDIIIDKDLDNKNYYDGQYWLTFPEGSEFNSIGSEEEPLSLQIKARGNWTRIMYAKKPFKIKLGKKQELLGLSKSKHFALLPHADDWFGFLRNFTGFNFAKTIGMPWTPSMQAIELVINGDYRGIYFVTESIRVESDRINIQELADLETDPALCSGGYVVEIDNSLSDNQLHIKNPQQTDYVNLTFEAPEELSEIQRSFLELQLNTINDLIVAHNPEVWKYLDLDMAVRFYIVQELMDNVESYIGSTFLYRDRGEGHKWIFSPVWDFGNSLGKDNKECYLYEQTKFRNRWIEDLKQIPGFQDKLEDTWNWYIGTTICDYSKNATDFHNEIKEAAVIDGLRWKDAPRPNIEGSTTANDNSDLDMKREYFLSHLGRKLNWLKTQWGEGDPDAVEPERDQTPAAPLPVFVTTGVEMLPSDNSVELGADSEYYTSSGHRISNPNLPGIYIVKTGGRYIKIAIP